LPLALLSRAQEAGESVVIFDLDPKSCAIRWGSKRMDCNLPVRTLAFARLSSALDAVAKRNVTLVVIDTPVLESPAALAAVKTADLTIVPTRPSAFDIWVAEVTGRRMSFMNERFAFLVNQCPPYRHSRHMRDSIASLKAIGPSWSPKLG
jgi:chromosome partitioning protein